MPLNIIKGTVPAALKMCIYAPESFGKTTMLSKIKNGVVLDVEKGSFHIDLSRVIINSWQECVETIATIIKDPGEIETVSIDSMDRLEAYAIDYLLLKHHKASIEDWSYGKGYVLLQELFQDFYKLLDKLIALGINVVIVAHAKPRKFELPDQEGAFDRWELKLNKQTAPLLKEWVDLLLFGNFETYVVTSETNKKKPQGNRRVLFTTHSPVFDAKNRFGLPEKMDFDFKLISHLFMAKSPVKPVNSGEKKESELLKKVKKLIEDNGVTLAEVEAVVTSKGHYPEDKHLEDYSEDFIARWIIPNIKKIVEQIKSKKEVKNDGK